MGFVSLVLVGVLKTKCPVRYIFISLSKRFIYELLCRVFLLNKYILFIVKFTVDIADVIAIMTNELNRCCTN